jgi:hypothetical protein
MGIIEEAQQIVEREKSRLGHPAWQHWAEREHKARTFLTRWRLVGLGAMAVVSTVALVTTPENKGMNPLWLLGCAGAFVVCEVLGQIIYRRRL